MQENRDMPGSCGPWEYVSFFLRCPRLVRHPLLGLHGADDSERSYALSGLVSGESSLLSVDRTTIALNSSGSDMHFYLGHIVRSSQISDVEEADD